MTGELSRDGLQNVQEDSQVANHRKWQLPVVGCNDMLCPTLLWKCLVACLLEMLVKC